MPEIAAKQRKAMPRGTPFPAGQSGNPNGRPRNEACVTPILRELLQTNPAALARLWQKRKSGTTGAMQIALALFSKAQKGDLAAITQVLNRIDGVPAVSLEHSGSIETRETITIDALRLRLLRLIDAAPDAMPELPPGTEEEATK